MSGSQADVLLLTKNGQLYLDELLTGVGNQLPAYGGRVFAMDSGSTDATLTILRRHGVDVHEIAPNAFQHGRTRNLIAGLTDETTKCLVFLTQDATPRDGWLAGLVDAVMRTPDVAGAFSRQVPRPDCNPLLARRMAEEWPQVGGERRIVKRVTREPSGNTQGISHAMAHFANTSSCVRREVWQRIPFPEVDFAEDVAWARRALDAGHAVVYEPSSTVWHSHSGSLLRTFAENVDHARGVRAAMAADATPGASDPGGPGAPRRDSLMPPENSVIRRVSRDMTYIWGNLPSLVARVGWTAYAPFWYAASVGGQWIGARRGRVFDRVSRRLSHQAAVARGGQR